MAISFLVYSSRDVVIDAAALVAELARAGWAAAMPPTHVWVGGAKVPGPTPLDGVLYGWERGAPDDVRVRELIAAIPQAQASSRAHPQGQLESLAHVAGCEVSGAAFEFEPGELDDYEEVWPELRERLTATRTQYVIRTGAGRSVLSVRFQEAVWRALATVVDGIRLDPASSTWT